MIPAPAAALLLFLKNVVHKKMNVIKLDVCNNKNRPNRIGFVLSIIKVTIPIRKKFRISTLKIDYKHLYSKD